jgi:hypothetical protein
MDQWLAIRKVRPWESAAIDDGAADRRAMASDIFGRRIDNDRRAVIEGFYGYGRGGVSRRSSS